MTARLTPLETLFESRELPASSLTQRLEELYGGPLGFDEPRVYANFVSTLDGVVAIPSIARSNELISMGSEGDRFIMGLLRALADVVLTGAGTVTAWPRASWMPERAYPPAATDFAELRTRLGKGPQPKVAILTGRGSIDPGHPALEAGALVLTSDDGAARLAGRLPAAAELLALGGTHELDPAVVVRTLRDRGHANILCEAGPHGFGAFLQAHVVDELFLTISPVIAGDSSQRQRLRLVEGAELLPDTATRGRVLSIKRHEDHLFLRYRLR